MSSTERRSTGVPISSASARIGAPVFSARTPGRSSRKKSGAVAQERPLHAGRTRIAASSAGGAGRDRLLDLAADVGERAERRVEVAEERGLRLGDRRDLGGRLAEAADEAAQVGARVARGSPRPAGGCCSSVGRTPSASLSDWPRRGEAAAELVEVRALRGARRLVEGGEDLVDLDRLRRRAGDGDRRAARVALALGALGDLDVLQAERRARADEQRRVARQRLDRGLELEVEHGDDGAVGLALAA